MTRRPRSSRKRSAASSSAKRLESAVVYLDESIYSGILRDALTAKGVSLRLPGIDVPRGTADEVWLKLAGKNGWIVLMRDQRVRHRPLEIDALRSARVGAFVLAAGQATAQATADVVTSRLIKLVNIATSEPRPFLYVLGLSGSLRKLRV
jgi:hypothetical protein